MNIARQWDATPPLKSPAGEVNKGAVSRNQTVKFSELKCSPGECDRRATALPFWKRTLDIAGIILLAPAFAPLMVFAAIAIRLSSRGPVFFRQERFGFGGQPFILLKFRTMHVDADQTAHKEHLDRLTASPLPLTKLDEADDRRVIRGGALLRASGLDELPQLLNVLRGEMSLVGPRPCMRYEYEKLTPEQHRRFDAVPGLTGLWQVSGKNSTTFEEMIALDIEYSSRLSLGRDLQILCRTLPVVFQQTGEILKRKLTGAKPVLAELSPREIK